MIVKKRYQEMPTLHLTTGEEVKSPILAPVEYLEASVAMCIAKTLDFLDARDGLELSGYDVRVTSVFDQQLKPRRISEVTVSIHFIDQLDRVLEEKLKVKAKRGCVIGHTLAYPVTVKLIEME